MPSSGYQSDLWQTILGTTEGSDRLALVTLLDSEGSTPAKIGSRAVVDLAGQLIAGTIGGGALEGFAQKAAVEAIRASQPAVFDFSLQGAGPPIADPICGGKLRVLVDPSPREHRSAYAQAAQAREQRKRGLLLTTVVVATGAKSAGADAQPRPEAPGRVAVEWVDESALSLRRAFPDAECLSDILRHEGAEFCVQDNPQTGERLEVLVEAIVPKPRLLIVGGGHVGQAIALQANIVGFDLSVIDDRAEFTNLSLFPAGTQALTGNIPESVAAFPFADDIYIALVTRGHKCDAEALEVCLRKPHAYLGMIGSKRKVVLVKKAFLESGRATPEEWEKIYTPIGLDIGALTVPEIATSIVAQLIAVRRKGIAPGMPR